VAGVALSDRARDVNVPTALPGDGGWAAARATFCLHFLRARGSLLPLPTAFTYLHGTGAFTALRCFRFYRLGAIAVVR